MTTDPLTEETATHRRCTQIQCGFYTQGGCLACDDCKSDPFVLNKTCDRCLDCEGVPESLRWGEKKAVQATQRLPPHVIEEYDEPTDSEIVVKAMDRLVMPPIGR